MNCFKNILWVLWTGVMVPVLFPWAIAPVPATGAQGPMLRIEAIPGVDQLVDIQTQVRHTTVIVLPENESILDFVVGDSEYWHLTGAANVAFLKPIATGVETNVALICESGRNLFLPRIRGRGAPPGRPDRAAARGRHPHIDRAPYSRLHCPFRSHRLSSHGATGPGDGTQCPGRGRHPGSGGPR